MKPLAVAEIPADAVTRGRWVFRDDVEFAGRPATAWHLDGDSGWWLRRRTGAAESVRWCGYCWTPPYSWWVLYRCPPAGWIAEPPSWAKLWSEGHGHCTHRHLLADAMTAAERAYDEHVLKALAGLWGST
jgi:hypothetical protein